MYFFSGTGGVATEIIENAQRSSAAARQLCVFPRFCSEAVVPLSRGEKELLRTHDPTVSGNSVGSVYSCRAAAEEHWRILAEAKQGTAKRNESTKLARPFVQTSAGNAQYLHFAPFSLITARARRRPAESPADPPTRRQADPPTRATNA